MAILGSNLPVIHKEEAENELKKVKGGRFTTPGMQSQGKVTLQPLHLTGGHSRGCCPHLAQLTPKLLPQSLMSGLGLREQLK